MKAGLTSYAGFFALAIVLTGCQLESRSRSDSSVRGTYGTETSRYGIAPVFPPREDVVPGDIFIGDERTLELQRVGGAKVPRWHRFTIETQKPKQANFPEYRYKGRDDTVLAASVPWSAIKTGLGVQVSSVNSVQVRFGDATSVTCDGRLLLRSLRETNSEPTRIREEFRDDLKVFSHSSLPEIVLHIVAETYLSEAMYMHIEATGKMNAKTQIGDVITTNGVTAAVINQTGSTVTIGAERKFGTPLVIGVAGYSVFINPKTWEFTALPVINVWSSKFVPTTGPEGRLDSSVGAQTGANP